MGRKVALRRLTSALTKATPDHLQIVGARFAGKTVLLHTLAEIMRRPGAPYAAVMAWDLGHQTPDSDKEFLLTLRDRMAEAIDPIKKDYAAHLRSVEERPYGELCEVFDPLRSIDRLLDLAKLELQPSSSRNRGGRPRKIQTGLEQI